MNTYFSLPAPTTLPLLARHYSLQQELSQRADSLALQLRVVPPKFPKASKFPSKQYVLKNVPVNLFNAKIFDRV